MKQVPLIIKVLLFFYLFSSFASATHHHQMHLLQDECKICIVVKNILNGDSTNHSTPSIVSLDILEYVTLHTSQTHTLYSPKSFHSQAPPLFS